ncbi:unnamed protein product [Ilex paraguariensis]|uniref:Protein kinase domain-containing protein n=1 Tax=Ilex paraguariensis TaxID=185542 RepID=A0ABC8S512_9AQUA
MYELVTDLTSCTKMYNISDVPPEVLLGDDIGSDLHSVVAFLGWSKPFCGNCEAENKYCQLKKNSTIQDQTECLDILITQLSSSTTDHEPYIGASSHSHKQVVAGEYIGIIAGVFLLVLVVVSLCLVIRSNIRKKEDQVKIENFLEDYKALKPARYSYADIKKITNQFRDKLGQGGYGTVFKGKLSNDIFVAVKVLKSVKGNGEEFINEVGTIGRIHHVNVVRLVGYCADGFRRALVYEFLPNDSLEKFIPMENQKRVLGWDMLQKIALGIAKGIEYLHQGCDKRILHFDIKPHNILLDHNFNPKISDFGLAKMCSKDQSIVSMTTTRGTIGYIAPEVFSRNFGNVSYKSDVYSFGMLLLEMVGVKKKVDVGASDTSESYFPEWIYNSLDQEKELEIQVEEEDDTKRARKLTIVGLWCVQWHPVDRPAMKTVIQMLEGEDNLSLPPNPFGSTNPMNTGATMFSRTFNSELETISELE